MNLKKTRIWKNKIKPLIFSLCSVFITVWATPAHSTTIPLYSSGMESLIDWTVYGRADPSNSPSYCTDNDCVVLSGSSYSLISKSLISPWENALIRAEFVTNVENLKSGEYLSVFGGTNLLGTYDSDSLQSSVEFFIPSISSFQLKFGLIDISPTSFAYIDNVMVYASTTPVPEPSTLALFGIGLAAMGLARRRKKV